MPSFDIISKVDYQEIDNVVNSVNRELSNRYDFKDAIFSIELNKKEDLIKIKAEDDYKLEQIGSSLKIYATKRNIDTKFFSFEDVEKMGGKNIGQTIKIIQGIDKDNSKKIIKLIKDSKLKIQGSIQGDEVRVTGKKIDDLQDIMSKIKSCDLSISLQFINFR
ncbi:YajQ family cyclic di-GMP-binding protein [Rickettsiales bacterium]|nr:YajQ family cyclic di-GMP-binding protein [Rickettsiales bacterium]